MCIRDRKKAFDVFADIGHLSDEALVEAIRENQIDILIDLGGHTDASRILALARRAAPVQVTYLGYPATVGADFIDYTLADKFVVPESEMHHFSEKLAYLPECFQVSDRKRRVDPRTPTRSECGLPEDGFIFCSFNNPYKINPPVFDVWMRLLNKVPGSVLWLFAENKWAQTNLSREAQARGIAPERLVFAQAVAHPTYLARLTLADLFLDSWPYNAGTTASDALWVGLPVLTCVGRSFPARMAGSLLNVLELPELITFAPEEYEAVALQLARTPELLKSLRQKLAANSKSSPLFDTPRTTRHIEVAYLQMWERYKRGDAPESFTVPAMS